MKYLKINPGQTIEMRADTDNVYFAVTEAILLAQKYLIEINLFVGEYMMGIDKDTVISDMMSEYSYWLKKQMK
ncbi:MAG TPA: hypothetical protein P5243_03000 [Bacteroidales bacterium]|nr:hypothetical protein [Bacteroidales bacterium]HRS18448.1 hypothetical protein [Bacteroidales bacterium]